jgi:tetratricopeptide (TPR) repeat protein
MVGLRCPRIGSEVRVGRAGQAERWRDRRALRRLIAAVERQDWTATIRHGDRLLGEETLPGEDVALVQLSLGTAQFVLGRPERALPLLESGIDSAPTGVALAEHHYFAGMSAMMVGDLDRARRMLRRAVAHPERDSWALDAARRGLAQVDTELGDLDGALSVVEASPMTSETYLLNEVIRASIHRRAGRADEARVYLFGPAQQLPEHPDRASPEENATVASMLVKIAGEYTELGHAAEARGALDEARRRFLLTGRPGLSEAAYLPVLEAEVSRLEGDLDAADRHLDLAADGAEGPADLEPLRLRAAARIAWERGDAGRAHDLWSRAADGFAQIDHRWMAAATRDEVQEGPPRPEPHPDIAELMQPPEGWQPPDGIVLSFAVTPEHGTDVERSELMGLAEEVGQEIEAGGYGEVDGWGSGDGTFGVYLNGDPDQLWATAEPRIRDAARRYDTRVVIQRDGEEIPLDLDP